MSKKNAYRKWSIVMIIGLLLIAAALGLVVYNKLEASQAETEAEGIMEDLVEVIEENAARQDTEEARIEEEVREAQGEMATQTIGDYEYIGSIEFPSLDITLPVMKDWNYRRLKVAACRYTGSYYTGDLVICAHNFEQFFAKIRWLPIGADVILTTVNGRQYHYVVANRENMPKTAVENMTDPSADWDLTLFTCNPGGQTRCAVRCELVN